MPAVIEQVAVYELHCTEKNRRYVFRVGTDTVQVQRWNRGQLEYRHERTKEEARTLYAFLIRLGYEKW